MHIPQIVQTRKRTALQPGVCFVPGASLHPRPEGLPIPLALIASVWKSLIALHDFKSFVSIRFPNRLSRRSCYFSDDLQLAAGSATGSNPPKTIPSRASKRKNFLYLQIAFREFGFSVIAARAADLRCDRSSSRVPFQYWQWYVLDGPFLYIFPEEFHVHSPQQYVEADIHD